MNLRDFLNGSNLWNEINTIQNFSFIQDTSLMDSIQVMEYGDRILFSGFENESVMTVASFIVSHFGDKWNAVLNAKIAELDITSDSTKRTVIDSNTEKNIVGLDSNVNKISGYNSDALITDTGNDLNKTEDASQETNSVKTESNGSFNALFNNLSTIEQSNIINLALKDVTTYLTINLY